MLHQWCFYAATKVQHRSTIGATIIDDMSLHSFQNLFFEKIEE